MSDILFENNEGKQVVLSGNLTLADMVRANLEFKITKDQPLEPGWYRAIAEVDQCAQSLT